MPTIQFRQSEFENKKVQRERKVFVNEDFEAVNCNLEVFTWAVGVALQVLMNHC